MTSGARVKVLKNDDFNNDTKVEFFGDESCCTKAKEMIDNLLNGGSGSGEPNPNPVEGIYRRNFQFFRIITMIARCSQELIDLSTTI